MKKYTKILLLINFFGILIFDQVTHAGTPFLISNPKIGPEGEKTLYLYSSIDKQGAPLNSVIAQSPILKMEAVIAPNVEANVVIPLSTYIPTPPKGKRTSHTGLGDVLVGVKHCFFYEPEGEVHATLYPTFNLPTGEKDLSLGNGTFWWQLPLWIQKKWGPWIGRVGGGYAFNPAPDKLHSFFGVGSLIYVLPTDLSLGMEVAYYQKNKTNTRNYALINIGAIYHFTKSFRAFGSVGHTVAGTKHLISTLGVGCEL